MNKSETAYKSISEVAKILNLINSENGKLNTHTIRFWEKKFSQLKPKKLSGNRRYYDQKAITLLKQIKYLLKEKGLTIKGAKKVLENDNSIKLDVNKKNFISIDSKKIKNKLKNISNLIKDIKKIK
mgnify:CR=1 FL=1|tara:strand:- start:21 stop:398 length:378 start_codon:yes stop_codon:yes gene_type:complete